MDTRQKNAVLQSLATLIDTNRETIIRCNQKDLEAYKDGDLAMYDRLKVDDKKVNGMVAAVQHLLQQADPENKILHSYRHPNGMLVENRVVPFGTILIIYESRPDVTVEAAITAFKAGNKILLKGGKEALNSNLCLVNLWHQALEEQGMDTEWVTYLDMNRTETQELIKNKSRRINLIIPRGGEGLINFVQEHANVPVIVSGRGNNFLYVDEDADFAMATEIILNGKSRISVCNALDKVLFHRDLPDLQTKMQQVADRFEAMNVEVMTGPAAHPYLMELPLMPTRETWAEEFLAPRIVFGVVGSLEKAIQKINTYSGGHSATIVTENPEKAAFFQREVDCAAVFHNASTRFTDGGEFGLGAEIAISTQKLHFRGPIGLAELVTNKWFIFGNGQIR